MEKIIKKAILDRNKIEIVYLKWDSTIPTRRIIHPYRIYHYGDYGYLYIDSYCELKNDERVFRLDRIQDLKVLNEHFTVTQDTLNKNIFMEDALRRLKKKSRSYSGNTSKSNCFIATAVFNSENANEVIVLKKWRDNDLKNKKIGVLFIKIYYKYGPFLARTVKKNKLLLIISRSIISRIVMRLEKK